MNSARAFGISSTTMRIAFLTSRLPYPPIGGGRLRPYRFLRHLLRSHEVTLYALRSALPGSSPVVPDDLKGLEQKLFRISPVGYSFNALKGLFSRLPLQVNLYESKSLMQALATEVGRGQVDLIFVHLIRMAEYARPFTFLPRILDMTDSYHMSYSRMPVRPITALRLAARLDRPRVARYESEVPRWFDAVLMASPVDLAWIRERTGDAKFVLVPQGVDLEIFQPAGVPVKTKRILFFGILDFLPNIDAATYFAKVVFPLVKHRVPNAEFVIAGWHPPHAVQRLGKLPGVSIRANVEDIRSEINQAVLTVAPLRFGAGMQTKIIESLALGVPVVATPIAAAPFGERADGPIVVGRSPEELAMLVTRLLTDIAHRERMGRAGRSMVESKYTWDRALAPLDDVLHDISAVQLAH